MKWNYSDLEVTNNPNDWEGKFYEKIFMPNVHQLSQKDAWIGIEGYPMDKSDGSNEKNHDLKGMEGSIYEIQYNDQEDYGEIFYKNIKTEGGIHGSPIRMMMCD